MSEAEDAVQEIWLRYETPQTRPAAAKSFLAAVVTRISIDVLRSARTRREQYVGPWLPEPLLADPYQDPERSAELADSRRWRPSFCWSGSARVSRFARIGGVVEPHQVNGQPGAIFRDRDGSVLSTWAFDILDGGVQTIRTVNNPDKLGHAGPVADAWTTLREATSAYRQ